MRIIIHGTGAVGGILAAALARSGTEVVAIARGRMLEAVRANGIRLRSPERDVVVPVPCVASPAEIPFRADDAILLCMKTQDTLPALEQLRAAGVTDQPIFCVQNGVENERLALRFFPNVHGVTVMMPATYLVPGEVITYAVPQFGMFDIGRFPAGSDAADTAMAERLTAANFAVFVRPAVMASKYGKLLLNLGNMAGAAFGAGAADAPLRKALRDEAVRVLAAAGIAWDDVGDTDPRRAVHTRLGTVPGAPDMSNSTLQSLQRGGSLETDYLNGEVCLLGRLHGVPTPLNDAMMGLAVTMLRDGSAPGTVDLSGFLARLGLA